MEGPSREICGGSNASLCTPVIEHKLFHIQDSSIFFHRVGYRTPNFLARQLRQNRGVNDDRRLSSHATRCRALTYFSACAVGCSSLHKWRGHLRPAAR